MIFFNVALLHVIFPQSTYVKTDKICNMEQNITTLELQKVLEQYVTAKSVGT